VRHHTAVEVDLGEQGKGWHYASLSRRGGHPLGYCTDHAPHPTEAEARTCYQQYLRDHIRLDGGPTSWGNCVARLDDGTRCKNPANRYATCGPYSHAHLCDEHLTREHAVIALGLDSDQAGESWES
jgi:hypothetical protein